MNKEKYEIEYGRKILQQIETALKEIEQEERKRLQLIEEKKKNKGLI